MKSPISRALMASTRRFSRKQAGRRRGHILNDYGTSKKRLRKKSSWPPPLPSAAESVSQVDAHGLAGPLLPLHFLFSATLLHWLVSLIALRVRCGQHHSSFRETSRLIPSEAVINYAMAYDTNKIRALPKTLLDQSFPQPLKTRALPKTCVNQSFSAACEAACVAGFDGMAEAMSLQSLKETN